MEMCMEVMWTTLSCCCIYSLGLPRRANQRIHASLHLLIACLLSALTSSFCSAQYMLEVLEKTYMGYHAVLRCDATGADFGMSISAFSYGLNCTGCAMFTEPGDACNTTTTSAVNSTLCHSQYAMVSRGNCSFSEKAYYAQTGRPEPYRAIVIYNEPGEPPLPMQGSKYADEVTIPVAMVSYACMQSVMGRYPPEHGYVVALRVIPGYYDFIKYLAPFVAVVGFCFIVLFVSLVVRVCRERRRIARKRLSRSNLKKLPTKKYRKGDQPETCAVCLDDFVEGEKLRILPCKHAYHCKCIDPWLTKNRKVCPICKRKVCSTGDSDSSDSDIERRRADAAAGRPTTTRENAPLLSNEQPMGSANISSRNGAERDVHYLNDDDSAGNQQQLPSSSGGSETTQAFVHNEEDATHGNVYADTVTAEGEPSAGISEAVRKRLRSLRPFVHGLVNRAIRASGRLDQDSQRGSGDVGNSQTFAAENGAFDGVEARTAHESTSVEGFPSRNGNNQREFDDAVANEELPPPERRRHPAAGGRLTGVKLDLNVELDSDESSGEEESVSKLEAKTLGSPHRSAFMKERREKESSRSMPGALRRGPVGTGGDHKRAEDADLESLHEPASRQRSREEPIFEASIDLDEEPAPHIAHRQVF
ncbi:unnamed protein product [Toxocara canis]|uniref:E3 ubiquitin-protein ligase RNF13 n=1 Tax=Toxocara canis TaxID=6265 RepID=A0A183UIX1_TOXCA|nr:unnamed protein product [Toxocara canis]